MSDYLYIPDDQIPQERTGPMLVERLVRRNLVGVDREIARIKGQRPECEIFITIAAVLPANR